MPKIDFIQDKGLNSIFFALKNNALLSLICDLQKTLFPNLMPHITWNENSFSQYPFLKASFHDSRCKRLREVDFIFKRYDSGNFFEDGYEKIQILEYDFQNVSSEKDLNWFKEKSDYEKILSILHSNYLKYPFKVKSNMIF